MELIRKVKGRIQELKSREQRISKIINNLMFVKGMTSDTIKSLKKEYDEMVIDYLTETLVIPDNLIGFLSKERTYRTKYNNFGYKISFQDEEIEKVKDVLDTYRDKCIEFGNTLHAMCDNKAGYFSQDYYFIALTEKVLLTIVKRYNLTLDYMSVCDFDKTLLSKLKGHLTERPTVTAQVSKKVTPKNTATPFEFPKTAIWKMETLSGRNGLVFSLIPIPGDATQLWSDKMRGKVINIPQGIRLGTPSKGLVYITSTSSLSDIKSFLSKYKPKIYTGNRVKHDKELKEFCLTNHLYYE